MLAITCCIEDIAINISTVKSNKVDCYLLTVSCRFTGITKTVKVSMQDALDYLAVALSPNGDGRLSNGIDGVYNTQRLLDGLDGGNVRAIP